MNSVIKGTGYILVHTPDMVVQNGTTQTTEKIVNPKSDYLKALPKHLRSYQDAVSYWPNQIYIGNAHPEDLRNVSFPYYEQEMKGAKRYGKFGEIMPEAEFMLLLQACDVFDVVKLDKKFVTGAKKDFLKNPIITEDIAGRLTEGTSAAEIKGYIKDEGAEALYVDNKLIGCVKRAHDIDVNLSARVIAENLMVKASGVLALLYGVKDAGVDKNDIEFVIECSEEACGDMNQRGGGNFAKSLAEIAGLQGATGADVRAFCGAPTHALVMAASLVKAGAFKMVAIAGGGCAAKLGMNGKDHVKKGAPILEDCLGGFSIIVAENDGVSPEVNLDILGRHSVGTGSSPQAVISSLVSEPLIKHGLHILDIDKFAPELQNADITKPAGAGDVPTANYKMIGALAAKHGEITPKELAAFVEQHGYPGWAPTQGHIPSGVPAVGVACQDILDGTIKRIMIIGKGSLFLGRMTDLFDGVSVIIQPNSGQDEDSVVSEEQVRGMIAKAMRDFAESLMPDETAE